LTNEVKLQTNLTFTSPPFIQLKEKDVQLKKAGTTEATDKKMNNLQEQIKTLTEAFASINGQCEQAETKLAETQDQVYLLETERDESKKVLQSTEAEVHTLRSRVAGLVQELELSQQELVQLREDAESQVSSVQQGFQERFESAQAEHDGAVAKLRACIAEQDARNDAAAARVLAAEEAQRAAAEARDALRFEAESLRRELAALEEKCTAHSAQMEEAELERSIEGKKRNNLVRELKEQLRRDALRGKELEAKLHEADDLIAALKRKLAQEDSLRAREEAERSNRSPSSNANATPPHAVSPVDRRMSMPVGVLRTNMSPSASFPPTPPPQHQHQPLVPQSVEAEVSAALSQRLTEVQVRKGSNLACLQNM
jgi:translation initiation factor IF-2